jgi:hypothetical protein
MRVWRRSVVCPSWEGRDKDGDDMGRVETVVCEARCYSRRIALLCIVRECDGWVGLG